MCMLMYYCVIKIYLDYLQQGRMMGYIAWLWRVSHSVLLCSALWDRVQQSSLNY